MWRHRRTPTPLFWRRLAAILAVLLGAAIVQKTAGFPFQREIPIGVLSSKQHRRRFSPRENHFAAIIPERYRSDLMAARGVVLEDGIPFRHRKPSIGALDGTIRGSYALSRKYVHFQTGDGKDPNTNGKTYTLRVPQRVKPGLLWGLFGGLALATHLGRSARPRAPALPWPPFRPRPFLEAELVFGLALIGGGLALARFHAYCDGGLCVLGMPYSDAIGWHQVAVFLEEGLGFSARYSDNRPFYPIFQAMVFLLTGPSVAAAQGTNVLLLAIGAFFVYATARELFPKRVAWCVFLFVLLAENHQRMAPMLITELTAYAFGAAGVFLLARGGASDQTRHRAWLLFLSGLFLGCSNLARPHTLFAVPLAGAVIVHAGVAGRWGWRSTLVRGCLFAGGFVLVILPWALREKRVHDVWGISLNSSEMLYATASTRGGKWNPEEFAEAARDGYTAQDPAALHQYFGRRLSETVRADPAAYAATVGRGFVDFMRSLTIEKPHLLAIAALGVLATLVGGAASTRSALPLLAAPVFWFIGSWAAGWRGYEILPLALLVILLAGGKRARPAVLIAIFFVTGTGLLSAMVGNFGLRRGEPIIEWIFAMTFLAATLILARLCCCGLRRPRAEVPPEAVPSGFPPTPLRGPVALANGLLALMILAGVGLVLRNATAAPPPAEIARLDEIARREALAATLARVPELAGAREDLLYAELVTVSGYRWKIPGGAELGHWSRLFERRRRSRSTAFAMAGTRPHPQAGMVGVHFRGSLDRIDDQHPHILVGLRNTVANPPMGHDGLVIEALALIPCDADGRNPDFGALRSFPPSEEALALGAPPPGEAPD